VMLFGWKRVPPWLHATSAVLVALGTMLSGFWILAASSWMHTPAGHVMRDGIAYPVNWLEIIFNPSFPYRFAHMMSAAYLTTSVVVLAVGARYLLARQFEVEGRTMMRMGVGMVALLGPLQLLIGDQHGLNTLEHQPVKIAAMEGHWDNDGPASLVLFAWPDEENERNVAEIALPNLASLILTHDMEGRVPGLKDFPREDRLLGLTGAFLWWRGKLFSQKWYLRPAGYAWPLGFIAILAGWITTESGRQPFIVYGIMRTSEGLSPVPAAAVASSFFAFVLVYLVVFSIGIYYMRRLIMRGPQGAAATTPEGLPNRPLSTAQDGAHE
jgi:cytochrome bd ubiquinol oxidase subunit I